MSLKLESLIQNGSNPSGLSCISPIHSCSMSHACIILLHIVWWFCVSVLSTAGPAPEEDRDYPNEEQYQCIDPSGKQPTIWSYQYNPMFSPLLSFTALRQQCFKLLCAAVVEPLSSAWPVIATVTRWNPLACVGVDWGMYVFPTLLCLLCLELCQVWFIWVMG